MPANVMMGNNFMRNPQNYHGIPHIPQPPMIHPSFMGNPPNHNYHMRIPPNPDRFSPKLRVYPQMGILPNQGSHGIPQAADHHGSNSGLAGDIHPHLHPGPSC